VGSPRIGPRTGPVPYHAGAGARRSLEKLNFTKLWKLHDVAVEANDPEACNYIEDMLDEQAADVKIAVQRHRLQRGRRAGRVGVQVEARAAHVKALQACSDTSLVTKKVGRAPAVCRHRPA